MIIEIKMPSPGESVSQAMLASWLVTDGDIVNINAEIAEIESDKATLPVYAPSGGRISIRVSAGEEAAVGSIIATIDTVYANNNKGEMAISAAPSSAPEQKHERTVKITPLAKRVFEIAGIDASDISEQGGRERIRKADAESLLKNKLTEKPLTENERPVVRKKMSPLRLKLAQRLVAVKNETAMLTTFNELDMTGLIDIKNRYAELFKKKTGYSLGFISFFARAVSMAIDEFPVINATIGGDEIVFPSYLDLNIAVSSPKGLLTPVIRDAHTLLIPDLEIRIKEMGIKASQNKISLDDLATGTFTITNGGVFGSMMSTPLINPPQSAILGMHKMTDRPVALKGEVVIRPIMYIALSYDHRIIDGRESVGFLMKIKELIENPVMLMRGGLQEIDDWLKG